VRRAIFITLTPHFQHFWLEANRNSSADVTDLRLKLKAVFSSNKGESNGVTSEVVLLCVGRCGALESNPEKWRKHIFASVCLLGIYRLIYSVFGRYFI